MGKSAGKWIKTVLFGKKNSKSNYSKNGTPDKKSAVKTPNEDPARDSSFIPDQLAERGVENLELEQGLSGSQGGAVGVGYVDQGIDSPKNEELAPVSDEEMRRQEEAATKTQAVFRGYLARRAFRALKGIIRLQALIRGHLVRRQAVATLRCMQAIVKLQAVARGRKVRLSDDIPEVGEKLNLVELQVFTGAHSGSFLGPEKLAVHPFIRKLLLILPTAMPLSLQYDPAEPNSAQNWLERWSLSRFWEPLVKAKRAIKSKAQRKPEAEHATKSKRTIRKASTTAHGENGGVASSEMDKPKRIPRKVTSQAEEQSQSELERVKRNLRKVSASAVAATEKPDPETEKPQPSQSVEIVASPPPIDVLEKETVISPENLESSDAVGNQQGSADLFEAHEKAIKEEPVDTQHDELPVAEIPSTENGVKTESAPSVEDESSCKEDLSRKENQKVKKRRSLPAKADYTENISQNSPSLPSYMAATESAKAKLRAQGAAAAKLAEEVVDYGNARRHSLPAPTNGKLTSLSPRIQKPVQVNGKGTKVNKSLSASREEKAGPPGWRR